MIIMFLIIRYLFIGIRNCKCLQTKEIYLLYDFHVLYLFNLEHLLQHNKFFLILDICAIKCLVEMDSHKYRNYMKPISPCLQKVDNLFINKIAQLI